MFEITEFECCDISTLSTSMLVSSGTEIARLAFTTDVDDYALLLAVAGEVSVGYQGAVYTDPEDFPEALLYEISETRGRCLFDGFNDDIECWASNHFELAILDGIGDLIEEPTPVEIYPDEEGPDLLQSMMEDYARYLVEEFQL